MNRRHHHGRCLLRHPAELGYSFILALLVLLPGAAALTAQAQQPFATDDTDTTEKGKFHFEFFNEHDVLQRSLYPARRQNTANFKLNYGITGRVELNFDVPLLTIYNSKISSLGNPTGIGDADIGVKYNFYREREGSRLPAMTVALYVEFPSGSVEKQLGSGLYDYNLYAATQKNLTKDTKLRANAGILFAGNNSTGLVGVISSRGQVLTAGTSLIKDFTSRFSLGAEVYGAHTSNADLGAGQITVLVGGKYQLRDNLSLDFGLLGGKGAASPRVGAVVGCSIDFE